MYAVVKTKNKDDESEIFVVLNKWLKNNFVYWPGNKHSTRAMKRKLDVNEDWAFFPCKVLKRDIGNLLRIVIILYIKLPTVLRYLTVLFFKK